MTKTYKPGKGYRRKDWDAVSDNPELTDEQMSKAKPFAEALPELRASVRRIGTGNRVKVISKFDSKN